MATTEVLPPPGLAPPWWLEEALLHEGTAEGERPAPAPPLRDEITVDLAIVGGGFTGLWTALALRERRAGLRVAVLEAEVCGWGPSGRNGGFMHGFETRMAKLRDLVGDAATVETVRAGARILPSVRAFLSEREEDVWFQQGGYLKVSASPAQDAVLDRILGTARALGLEDEAVPLSREEVAERIRSPRFRRGVLFRNCATVQPARLARALRRAVLTEGVSLYERTPVFDLGSGRQNVLRTPAGLVRAEQVVLAANTALTGFPPLARRLTNASSYIVLTEPVPRLIEELGWTGGEAVTDGRSLVHYFRTTRDDRVLMGVGGGPIGYGGRVGARLTADRGTATLAECGLRRLLPALASARVARSWGGPIDISADHIPFFGTLPGTSVHYGVGYSGSGVGPSWIGGQILASLVLDREDEWTALPLVSRDVPRLPPEPIRWLGGNVLRRAMLACEQAEERGRRGPIVARGVARLPDLLGMQIGTR